jgi:hypothetical protein
MAGAAVGSITGYLFGTVLYILVICSSAFSSDTNVATLVTSSGVYPLMFALFVAAIGFFSGWYISYTQDLVIAPSTPKTA